MTGLRENWTQYVTDEGEDGRKFWEIGYYLRDYDRFMLDFNQALAGAPPYPISIEYYQDPEWAYWTGIRENFA